MPPKRKQLNSPTKASTSRQKKPKKAAEREFAAKAILAERIVKGKLQYEIDWAGIDPKTKRPYKPSWEPEHYANDALREAWVAKQEEKKALVATVGGVAQDKKKRKAPPPTDIEDTPKRRRRSTRQGEADEDQEDVEVQVLLNSAGPSQPDEYQAIVPSQSSQQQPSQPFAAASQDSVPDSQSALGQQSQALHSQVSGQQSIQGSTIPDSQQSAGSAISSGHLPILEQEPDEEPAKEPDEDLDQEREQEPPQTHRAVEEPIVFAEEDQGDAAPEEDRGIAIAENQGVAAEEDPDVAPEEDQGIAAAEDQSIAAQEVPSALPAEKDPIAFSAQEEEDPSHSSAAAQPSHSPDSTQTPQPLGAHHDVETPADDLADSADPQQSGVDLAFENPEVVDPADPIDRPERPDPDHASEDIGAADVYQDPDFEESAQDFEDEESEQEVIEDQEPEQDFENEELEQNFEAAPTADESHTVVESLPEHSVEALPEDSESAPVEDQQDLSEVTASDTTDIPSRQPVDCVQEDDYSQGSFPNSNSLSHQPQHSGELESPQFPNFQASQLGGSSAAQETQPLSAEVSREEEPGSPYRSPSPAGEEPRPNPENSFSGKPFHSAQVNPLNPAQESANSEHPIASIEYNLKPGDGSEDDSEDDSEQYVQPKEEDTKPDWLQKLSRNPEMESNSPPDPSSFTARFRNMHRVIMSGSSEAGPSSPIASSSGRPSPSGLNPLLGAAGSSLEGTLGPSGTGASSQGLGFHSPQSVAVMPIVGGHEAAVPETIEPSALIASTGSEILPTIGHSTIDPSDDMVPALDSSSSPGRNQENAGYEHTVTLPLMPNIGPKYLSAVNSKSVSIDAFSKVFTTDRDSTPDKVSELEIDNLFSRLLDFCDLPPSHDNFAALTQEQKAKYAAGTNAKMAFVEQLLLSLRHDDLRVLVLVRPGPALSYLTAIMETQDFDHRLLLDQDSASTEAQADEDDEQLRPLTVLLASTELSPALLPADVNVVVSYDESSRSKDLLAPYVARTALGSQPMVLSLVATYTLEHIDMFVPRDVDRLERMNALLLGVVQARAYLESPPLLRERGDPIEVAKQFATLVMDPTHDWAWIPQQLSAEVLDCYLSSQRSGTQTSTGPSLVAARKRPLEDGRDDKENVKRAKSLSSLEQSRRVPVLDQNVTNLLRQYPADSLQRAAQEVERLQKELKAQEDKAKTFKALVAKVELERDEYREAVKQFQPKYVAAQRDRSSFQAQAKAAEEKQKKAEDTLLEAKTREQDRKQENAALKRQIDSNLALLAASPDPIKARLGELEQQVLKDAEKIASMGKRYAIQQKEMDFIKERYLETSQAAAELGNESLAFQAKVKELERLRDMDVAKVHQINRDNHERELVEQRDQAYKARDEANRHIVRLQEENAQLRSTRRETRQSSAGPRSPRLPGVMSPRTNQQGGSGGPGGSSSAGPTPNIRGGFGGLPNNNPYALPFSAGGQGAGPSSRGTSPAATASGAAFAASAYDVSQQGGYAGGSGSTGGNFLTQTPGNPRWGHLRD